MSPGFGTSTSASGGLFGQDKTTTTGAGLFGGSVPAFGSKPATGLGNFGN